MAPHEGLGCWVGETPSKNNFQNLLTPNQYHGILKIVKEKEMVSMEKQISLLEEAQRVGAEVLAFTNLTSHPDDWYLSKVLAKRNGEYVTWIFNWSVGCLNSGHYYSTWDSAEADYKARK